MSSYSPNQCYAGPALQVLQTKCYNRIYKRQCITNSSQHWCSRQSWSKKPDCPLLTSYKMIGRISRHSLYYRRPRMIYASLESLRDSKNFDPSASWSTWFHLCLYRIQGTRRRCCSRWCRRRSHRLREIRCCRPLTSHCRHQMSTYPWKDY